MANAQRRVMAAGAALLAVALRGAAAPGTGTPAEDGRRALERAKALAERLRPAPSDEGSIPASAEASGGDEGGPARPGARLPVDLRTRAEAPPSPDRLEAPSFTAVPLWERRPGMDRLEALARYLGDWVSVPIDAAGEALARRDAASPVPCSWPPGPACALRGGEWLAEHAALALASLLGDLTGRDPHRRVGAAVSLTPLALEHSGPEAAAALERLAHDRVTGPAAAGAAAASVVAVLDALPLAGPVKAACKKAFGEALLKDALRRRGEGALAPAGGRFAVEALGEGEARYYRFEQTWETRVSGLPGVAPHRLKPGDVVVEENGFPVQVLSVGPEIVETTVPFFEGVVRQRFVGEGAVTQLAHRYRILPDPSLWVRDVEVVVPALPGTAPDTEVLGRLLEALRLMPAEALEPLRRVVVNPAANRHDAFWQAQFGLKDMKSAASAGWGEVNFFPAGLARGGSREVFETLAHELGHLVAEARHRAPAPPGWERAAARDARSVSAYGEMSLGEDFAEAMRVYLASGGGAADPGLLVDFSHRFRLIDDVLGLDAGTRRDVFERLVAAARERGIVFAGRNGGLALMAGAGGGTAGALYYFGEGGAGTPPGGRP